VPQPRRPVSLGAPGYALLAGFLAVGIGFLRWGTPERAIALGVVVGLVALGGVAVARTLLDARR